MKIGTTGRKNIKLLKKVLKKRVKRFGRLKN